MVGYTEEGVADWCTNSNCAKSLYFKKDLDLNKQNFSPSDEVLTSKKIHKLYNKNKLMIRILSGLWVKFRIHLLYYFKNI